jgi:GDPmannose 4,6-dehydratase
MYLMLQQDAPDDYVVASGYTRSVREFAQHAFGIVGLNYQDYVVEDPQLYRPAEVELLQGDATKARERLGWVPKHSFDQLVEQMVAEDLRLVGS